MSTRVYDFGDTFFCSYLRDGFVGQAFSAGNQLTMSMIESNRGTIEAEIQKVLDALEE